MDDPGGTTTDRRAHGKRVLNAPIRVADKARLCDLCLAKAPLLTMFGRAPDGFTLRSEGSFLRSRQRWDAHAVQPRDDPAGSPLLGSLVILLKGALARESRQQFLNQTPRV